MFDVENIDAGVDDFDWDSFDPVEFRHWLETDAPIYQQFAPLWMRAVEHKYAWTCGRAYAWDSPQRLVTSHYDLIGGPFCWISRKGVVYPCGFAGHDALAEIIIGASVDQVETEYARVSGLISSIDDCFKHVYRPSTKMRNAAYDWVEQNKTHFAHLR